MLYAAINTTKTTYLNICWNLENLNSLSTSMSADSNAYSMYCNNYDRYNTVLHILWENSGITR